MCQEMQKNQFLSMLISKSIFLQNTPIRKLTLSPNVGAGFGGKAAKEEEKEVTG